MSELDPWLSQRLAASELFTDAEARMEAAMREVMQRWLTAVRRLVLGADAVTAAGPPDLGGIAASDPEWIAALTAIARPVLEDLFDERFLATARVATISAQPYRQAYIEQVFSRLRLFTAEQFEEIRPELAEAISEGETLDGIRDRVAAILDFDTTTGARGEQGESRRIQARINQLEKELDRGGLTQSEAASLRAERRRLYPELYASRRRWEWKAQRIARTETSGALNGGSYWGTVARSEIFSEQLYKQWLSTEDERTRPTHVLADGQVQRLERPFVVGLGLLIHPGDPTGPPQEIIQCRCTALYLDRDELTPEQIAAVDAAGPDGATEAPVEGGFDALTTEAPTEAELDEADAEAELAAGLAGEAVPSDLDAYTLGELVDAYPHFAALDPDGSLRILERMDALEALQAPSAQLAEASAEADTERADLAVATMAGAGDVAEAVDGTLNAWGQVRAVWAGDSDEAEVPLAPWALTAEPEPVGEGPGYHYEPEIDDIVVDAAVPAGWVLYTDPYTGNRSYYEAAGLPRQLSRARKLAAAKEAYADWVHVQFLDAELATRGNLFSKKGLAAGVPERSLWSSNAVSARAWASDELLRYWRDHPRLTQIEWLYQQTGDERYRVGALRARENTAHTINSFALDAGPFAVDLEATLALTAGAMVVDALTAAAARARAYTRAELAAAWQAGTEAGKAGAELTACPYRPRLDAVLAQVRRADGVLALLWVRAWRAQDPLTIIASGEKIMANGGSIPNGWRGVIAALNVPTGDGRQIATPAGGIRTRTPPLSIMWQESLSAGHDGAVVVARADRAWVTKIDGVEVIMGEGPFDLGGDNGREAARLLGEGFFNGISMDPDEVTFTEEFRDAAGALVDVDDMDLDEFYDAWESGAITPLMVMTDWRLMGATLTPQPAFNQTRIEPLYDYVPAEAQAGDLTSLALAAGGTELEAAPAPVVGRIIRPVPAEHYADPELKTFTPLTVTDDGRVFGHIAPWDSCHIGFGSTCVSAPHSLTAYAHFHLGEVATTEGRLAAGKLTLGGGHADPALGYRAAIEHYDDVATAVAGVRAGEDAFGIWVAGRILSGVSAEIIERFMLCPPSGDWRRIGGNLELVAACSVNVPGFPVLRTVAASAGGLQTSLIAAGARELTRARRRADRARGPIDLDRLAVKVARQVRAYDVHAARADALSRRIGRDLDSRASRALARLGNREGE